MISRDMHACVNEALKAIRNDMPEGSDLSEWFNISPAAEHITPRMSYWAGYLTGAADLAGVTVLEMLDEAGIDCG